MYNFKKKNLLYGFTSVEHRVNIEHRNHIFDGSLRWRQGKDREEKGERGEKGGETKREHDPKSVGADPGRGHQTRAASGVSSLPD